MTEEEKKQAELAAAEQAKAHENESPEEKQAREAKEREDSLKKDYEERFAREKKAREDAEKAAADLSFKLRERKRKGEDEDEGFEEDKPLTGKQLEVILARERQTTRKEFEMAENERIAKELAGSDVESQLTLEILRNTTFPSHYSQREKVEGAWAIANSKKLIGERNEALRALRAREAANNNPAGSHHDPIPGTEPKLSPADELAIKAVGFAWNSVSRQYEKKLKNGNVLVRDSKTKQTYLVKKS